ncbi:MAG: glutamate-5-semialdehyde dehydrogenase [Cyanobacteria bacterium]|nr:glutamate-5-semialdehyde dehydrogenase [Cyanobacteriota bacterium]
MSPQTESLESLLQQSRNASYGMAQLSTELKNEMLEALASLIEKHSPELLAANAQDLEQYSRNESGTITDTLYQRLKLDAGKLQQLGVGIRDVAKLPDPNQKVLSRTLLDTGLVLEKISVPLGVVAVIFESRPDVMPQIMSLGLKSGNALILKGGKEAFHSNRAFYELALKLNAAFPQLPVGWVQYFDTREAVQQMLAYPQYVDLVIPRGSNQLVQSIMASTKIPVMGHADGVCHVYVHESADLNQALALVVDAKTQYAAACNAAETLLVDRSISADFLKALAPVAEATKIQLIGCEATQKILPDVLPATEADWRTEYGDFRLSVKVVDSVDEAIAHINQYGSHHTDAILSKDNPVIEQFLNQVDSACVFANASTRFADGFRFGFGAEVGISTSKTHARGPVGLEGLMSSKFKLRGAGQVVQEYVGPQAKSFLHQSIE